jgi:predicted regulator of Ras-like GTPase activity (Roadblock/LC7/MglB family)
MAFNPKPGEAFLCSVIKKVSDLYLVKETTSKVEGYLSAPGHQLSIGQLAVCEFVRYESYGPLFSCAAWNVEGDDGIKLLSFEANQELGKLLDTVNEFPNVIGSLIVGHDGLILGSKLPESIDAELLARVTVALFSSSESCVQVMERQRLHQIVLSTIDGHIILANFGGGILVTVMDDGTSSIIPTMRRITQLVAS